MTTYRNTKISTSTNHTKLHAKIHIYIYTVHITNTTLFLSQQAARVQALQAAYRKAEAEGGYLKANPPTAGQIRNLGILGKEEDSKAVLTSK